MSLHLGTNTFRAFRNRNYRLFYIGQSISRIGMWMQRTAVLWVVYTMTHSPFMLGVAMFAEQFPSFLFSLLGGVISDRYDRYKLLLLTQTASMVQAILLTVLVFSGSYAVWQILALSFLLGMINALDVPTRQPLVHAMVNDPADLPNAVAFNSSLANLAKMIGPAVGGLVLKLWGADICFLLNAVSFIAVISCLLMMKLPRQVRHAVKKKVHTELADAFRYLRNTPEIAHVIGMLALMSLLVLPYRTLLPIFAKVVFLGDAGTYGVISGFIGLGALLGAVFLASLRRTDLKHVLLINTVLLGIGLIAFSVMRSFPAAMAVALVIGFRGHGADHRMHHHRASAVRSRFPRPCDELRGHGLIGNDAVGQPACRCRLGTDRGELRHARPRGVGVDHRRGVLPFVVAKKARHGGDGLRIQHNGSRWRIDEPSRFSQAHARLHLRPMLRSMTGFGRAEGLVNEKKVTVELRSVNSKQLDLQVKMPSVWREKETELRQWAGERVVRGKADLFVGIDGTKAAKRTTFNADLIHAYHDELRAVARSIAPESNTDLLAVVLRMPDVMSTPKEELEPAEWTATQELIEQAWQAYESFRKAEGGKLHTELKDRTANIMRLLGEVEAMDSGRIGRTRERILSRLEELKAKVDQDRFEQELVFYLDKMDVTEEKVRLAAHCSYFTQTMDSEESQGRKLGFITQEMGREINTLGSKSNDADMQRTVVLMKDELEKIKEQMLNVL